MTQTNILYESETVSLLRLFFCLVAAYTQSLCRSGEVDSSMASAFDLCRLMHFEKMNTEMKKNKESQIQYLISSSHMKKNENE